MSYLYNETLGSTIYDNNYTGHVNELKNKYYKEQKINALNPVQHNIITPYSRTLFNTQVMGPAEINMQKHASNGFKDQSELEKFDMGSNSKSLKYESVGFDMQFDLAKFDNRDGPKSFNEYNTTDISAKGSATNGRTNTRNNVNPLTDSQWSNFKSDSTDMTYGVVDKKDFLFESMVPFTSRRETIIENQDNSNSSLYLSNFTGVGLKPKKHEVEAFFQPKDSKKETLFVNMTSDEIRDRYMSSNSIRQNGQRPFEPEQVGPGLGLDKSVQNLGGLRDDTRILYKTSNELRNKLNQQVSYTAPVKPGRLGDAGTTAQSYGDVKKYRPETFTAWSEDTIWAGRGASNAQQAPLPYIMKDTTRIKSMEQIGPSQFSVPQFSKNAYGEITETFRQELGDVPIVSFGGSVKGVGQGKDSSYQMVELQRDTTNQPFNTVAAPTQQGYVSAYLDEAKGTVRQETNKPFNTMATPSQYAVTSMYSDNAKGTVRQETNGPFNTFTAPLQQSVTSMYSDNAKGTVRQETNQPFNTFSSPAQQSVISGYQDNAKGTVRQETNQPFNTFSSPAQQSSISMLSDDAKGTIRQETNGPFNTFSSPAQQSVTSMYSDNAKGTVRQETNKPFNTNVGPAQQSVISMLSDNAKGTIRQETNGPFNTNMKVERRAITAYYTDEAKGTVRQETNSPFNTHVGGPKLANQVALSDEAKGTIKQDTLLEDYLSGGGADSLNKITTYLQDQAKGTIKQDTLLEDYISSGGADSLNKLTTYLQDQAKGTIKQDTLIENYVTNAQEPVGNVTTRLHYKHIQSSDGRETVAKERAPTWNGFAETPSTNQVNMMLKDAATYDAYLHPNKATEVLRADFMQIAKKNDVQQTQQIFDNDFINIMGNYMTNNSLVNNLVHKGSYNQNPVNTFTFNKS